MLRRVLSGIKSIAPDENVALPQHLVPSGLSGFAGFSSFLFFLL